MQAGGRVREEWGERGKTHGTAPDQPPEKILELASGVQPSATASGGRQGERRKVGDEGCETGGGEQRTARRGYGQDRRQGLKCSSDR